MMIFRSRSPRRDVRSMGAKHKDEHVVKVTAAPNAESMITAPAPAGRRPILGGDGKAFLGQSQGFFRDFAQGNHMIDAAEFDRFVGHAEHDAAGLVLSDCLGAGLFHGGQSPGAVGAIGEPTSELQSRITNSYAAFCLKQKKKTKKKQQKPHTTERIA